MALEELLNRLHGADVTPVTPARADGVTRNPAPILGCTRVTPVTPENSEVAARAAGATDVDRPRPLTADEARLLNWWLDAIGEDDPVCRRRVRELAETRQGARAFFIGCARERATTEHGS